MQAESWQLVIVSQVSQTEISRVGPQVMNAAAAGDVKR
jgi:hypothetical protein